MLQLGKVSISCGFLRHRCDPPMLSEVRLHSHGKHHASFSWKQYMWSARKIDLIPYSTDYRPIEKSDSYFRGKLCDVREVWPSLPTLITDEIRPPNVGNRLGFGNQGQSWQLAGQFFVFVGIWYSLTWDNTLPYSDRVSVGILSTSRWIVIRRVETVPIDISRNICVLLAPKCGGGSWEMRGKVKRGA